MNELSEAQADELEDLKRRVDEAYQLLIVALLNLVEQMIRALR